MHAVAYRAGEVSTSPDSKAIRNAEGLTLAVGLVIHVSTSPDSKAIRNNRVEVRLRGRPGGFQLPRIAKPSGTKLAVLVALVIATLFQLPRIAKPSGTFDGMIGDLCTGVVSTSPDSKAIRNCDNGQVTALLTFVFQLPRIAKPSGTCEVWPGCQPATVFQLPRIAKPSGTQRASVAGQDFGQVVSTSPDSKAIRNARSARIASVGLETFQLPRIAKPSGTPALTRPGAARAWWAIYAQLNSRAAGKLPQRGCNGSDRLRRNAARSSTVNRAAGLVRGLRAQITRSSHSGDGRVLPR